MLSYIARRLLYAIPILVGVNILTFILFFIINSPDDMARAHLGEKYITQEDIDTWKANKGYNKPLFYNSEDTGLDTLTNTIFFNNSLKLFVFDFGQADDGRDITTDIKQRMWPSLAFAIPNFVIGLTINICIALLVIMFRGTKLDQTAVAIFVALLSISYLFYIIVGQYFFAKEWKLVPISGFLINNPWKFLILPIMIGVISGIGQGARLYRTFFLEEAGKDYARTARAKGVSELQLLFKHVLPNTLIPILTGVVVVIPVLFMGALVMESFFGIPGLGSYMLDAIRSQDFAIVRSMVFIGSVLYIAGLLLTDISYTWADPRVRLS
jgi:peptide/nickel transport system permease protein